MDKLRKTKIVCTVGPASQDYDVMKKLVESGMNVMRMNFSHGSYEEHQVKIQTLRKINQELDSNVAIMLDTKGPEIRTHKFEFGGTTLIKDSIVRISMEEVLGNNEKFSVTYPKLIDDVKIGGQILVDDGNVELDIIDIDKTNKEIVTKVKNNAYIKDRRGVNVPDVKLTMPFISKRDYNDILFGCSQHVDYIAASFVRRPSDILEIRDILNTHHSQEVKIIAKIENVEAVKNIDEIIKVTDAVMVARGDLGVEVPVWDVPVIQKEIIKKCILAGKPVIVATQMLESMQKNPRPTRAEVNDVATAVLSGADAIMLSGETASGLYPVESVEIMDKIARRMESVVGYEKFLNLVKKSKTHDINSSIALSVVDATNQLDVSCIIAPTTTGLTASNLSNFRPPVPIIAVTDDDDVMQSLALTWGVYPIRGAFKNTTDEVIEESIRVAKEKYHLNSGEIVVVSCNMPIKDKKSHANMMKIHII